MRYIVLDVLDIKSIPDKVRSAAAKFPEIELTFLSTLRVLSRTTIFIILPKRNMITLWMSMLKVHIL